MDNIVGTAGNDVIGGIVAAAPNGTLQAFDAINGGGGTDTLKVQLGAAYGGGASIRNVEVLEITQTGAFDFNATGIEGLEVVANNGGTGGATTVTGVGNVVDMKVRNTNQAFGVTYADDVLNGSADEMDLIVDNVTGGAAITITQATAKQNSIETLNVMTTGAASNFTLTTDGTQTSLKTINVSGDKNVTLILAADNVATSATTIDASDLTGNLDLQGLGAAAHNVKGGAGNDIFRFGANLGTTDKIDGNGGVNTLAANGDQLAAITTKQADFKNLQTLMLQNDVGATATTINASNFGDVNNFRVVDQATAGAANITVNNLMAAATGSTNTIRFDGDSGANVGNFRFNIKDATDPGTANDVTLDFRGASFGAAGRVSTITLNGVETVTIDTTESTNAKVFNLAAAALNTLTIKGTQAVNLSGTALGANVSKVDASGSTGAINIALNGAAATGAAITGTSAADTIRGSNQKDIITAGAGADTVIASGGQDVINLGAGADVFRILDGSQALVRNADGSQVVHITDFVAGTDKINFETAGAASTLNGVTLAVGTTVAAMQDALTNTTAVNSIADVYTQLAASLTAGNFAGSTAAGGAGAIVARVVDFTNGDSAGKYLVINDNVAGFNGANDIVINITGLTGTIAAGDFTFTA